MQTGRHPWTPCAAMWPLQLCTPGPFQRPWQWPARQGTARGHWQHAIPCSKQTEQAETQQSQ
eukprot:3363767-Lingulodinium_polyedra.AAC.1